MTDNCPHCGKPLEIAIHIGGFSPAPEGQGPEMTIEQLQALYERYYRPVWHPLVDVLRGDAP